MPLRTKVGLSIVLCLSFITFVGAIMKIITPIVAHTQYSSSVVVLWAVLEQTLVIIISCVPSLRHLANTELPRIKTLGSSIVRLVTANQSRRGSATSVAKSNNSGQSHTAYTNIDSNAKEQQGKYPRDTSARTFPGSHDTTSREAIAMGNYINRTESFSVEYGPERR